MVGTCVSGSLSMASGSSCPLVITALSMSSKERPSSASATSLTGEDVMFMLELSCPSPETEGGDEVISGCKLSRLDFLALGVGVGGWSSSSLPDGSGRVGVPGMFGVLSRLERLTMVGVPCSAAEGLNRMFPNVTAGSAFCLARTSF